MNKYYLQIAGVVLLFIACAGAGFVLGEYIPNLTGSGYTDDDNDGGTYVGGERKAIF